jgi:hypothetical protein
MTEYTLTVLDTPGIQPYIFGSNRLRESIGASEVVRLATGQWPLEILAEMGKSNVLQPDAIDPARCLDDTCHIEDEESELFAEIVYVGGGNTVILFRDLLKAKEFVTVLSKKLLESAPGLNLAVAHVSVSWGSDSLQDKVDEAMLLLARHKAASPAPQPLLGLGVTMPCRSTGMVATTTNADYGKPSGEATYPISAAVAAKLTYMEPAQTRLRDIFPGEIKRAKYDFPRDFDDFGRSEGDMSYIAVVHADGNQMGKFFRQRGEQADGPRAYIRAMRTASIQVAEAATTALHQTVSALLGCINVDKKGYFIPTGYDRKPIRLKGNKLPFRPLVFGGDDVTFVCDGRLGLTLAAHYLAAFDKASDNLKLGIHACAGIAVVKTHYPFIRAYELSESLAKSAKTYVRDQDDIAALDWHFAAGGLLGSLQTIRGREYTVNGKPLNIRPLTLQSHDWRAWPRFQTVVQSFLVQAKEQRNKVIALREALRKGLDGTQEFLKTYNTPLPELDVDVQELQDTGWYGDRCGYFDAIEAMDFYVALEGERYGNV